LGSNESAELVLEREEKKKKKKKKEKKEEVVRRERQLLLPWLMVTVVGVSTMAMAWRRRWWQLRR